MQYFSPSAPYIHPPDKNISRMKTEKITFSLVKHVYEQTITAMLASLFCTSLILFVLYDSRNSNVILLAWAAFTFSVTFARIALVLFFKSYDYAENRLKLWVNLYILGALLGGACWGLMGIYLFPSANPVEQTFMILMVAGVTAGAVPLSAAIPGAAAGFLIAAIIPLILTIALIDNHVYHLFDFALSVYLAYLILITLKTHKLIKNSIVLKYDNDILLINLEISNKKLEQAATHDPLTKIPNRRLFQTNLANALARARKSSRILALLYIDLDNFKTVNDLYGHQTGDRILQIMINRLRNYFRKDDILARLGGDELAVIIENVNGHEDIETIARKICYLIAIPVKLQNATLQISASVGISVYPDDGADEESLLKCADTCMYYAKEHGGNKFYFSEKLTT